MTKTPLTEASIITKGAIPEKAQYNNHMNESFNENPQNNENNNAYMEKITPDKTITLYPTLLVLFTYLFVIAYCIPIYPSIILKSCNNNKSLAAKYNGYSLVGKGLLQLIISPIIGAISDKYGRKYFLIGCLISLGLQIWILVIFMKDDSINLDVVMFVRVLAGTSDAILTIIYAAITDVTTTSHNNESNGSGVRKKDLSTNFGTVGAIFGISFILGPATGGFITSYLNNIKQSLAIVGSIVTIMTIHTILSYKEPLEECNRLQCIQYSRFNPMEPIKVVCNSDALRSLCIPYLLYEISFHVNTAWILWVQYRYSWEIIDVGCYLSALGLSIAFFQAYVLRIYVPKHINERQAIIYGYTSCSLYYFLSGIMPHGYMLYFLLGFVGYGSLAGPCLRSTLSSHISNYNQGLLQGALDSITTIASIIAGYVFNTVLSWSSQQDGYSYFYTVVCDGAINFLASAVLVPSIYLVCKALKLYALKDELLSDSLVDDDDNYLCYGTNQGDRLKQEDSITINDANFA